MVYLMLQGFGASSETRLSYSAWSSNSTLYGEDLLWPSADGNYLVYEKSCAGPPDIGQSRV